MQKVLHTLRVLEIGGLGPGPFCAMHLADLGADVISLVRPGKPESVVSKTMVRNFANFLHRDETAQPDPAVAPVAPQGRK